MKVLVRLLVLYAALAAGWHVYVQRNFPRAYDGRVVALIAAASFIPLAVFASSGRNLADAFRAASGPRPARAPGEPAALGGRIVSRGGELVSPFLRQPCLAYAWAVSAWGTRWQGGRSRTMVIPEYEGHVEAALSLRTDAGDVPLLRDGVGTLLEKVDDAPGTNGRRRADEEIDLRENARAYLAGANPKDAPAPDTGAPMIAPGGLLKAAEGALRERREAERADGSYRLEWKFPVAPREIDLSGRYLEETYLPPQEPCWVFGVWSGEPSGVRVRRIVLGERGSVVGTLLLGSLGYLVMGAVVSAFFAFVVRTFLRSS